MKPVRIVVAAVVVIVMGIAIVGIAQGNTEWSNVPEPTAAQVATSKSQVAAGGAQVQKGKEVFAEEGCNRCHSLAATGANGKLGPRMDSIPDEASENAQYIARTMRDSDNIMPRDYAKRMSATEIMEVSQLIHAAYIKGTGD